MKKAFSIFMMALMLLLAFSGCEDAQPKQIEVDGMAFTEASAQDTAVTDENFFVRGKCVDVVYDSLLDFSTYTFTVESKIGTFGASLTISPSYYENIDTDLAESFKGKEITILGRFSDMVSKTTNEQVFLCSHYQIDETGDPLRFTAENVLGATKIAEATPTPSPTPTSSPTPTTSPTATPTATPAPESEEYESFSTSTASVIASQLNAVSRAKEYLSVMSFSHDGLVEQLEYEKFSYEDAVYGADNCGADWYEQAEKKAQEYLDVMSFSRDDLIDQLEYEGFTHEQAVHGVDAAGL